MTVFTSNDKLEVFDEPVFDNSLVSLHEFTHKPYGSPAYKNSDVVRIQIQHQDNILDIAESSIDIIGKFKPTDATKTCYLSNNFLYGLFEEARYEMGGEKVAECRKPIISSTMKQMACYGKSQTNTLRSAGWGCSAEKQDLYHPDTNVFSGRIKFKDLFSFGEDYTKGIINTQHELILTIARTFNNCYVGEVQADIQIDEIQWRIKHIVPDDRAKLKLLSRTKSPKTSLKVCYRMADLYELPPLTQTSSDMWVLKISTSLERPRFVLLALRNAKDYDNRSKNVTKFTHGDIMNVRVHLNSP